MHNFDLLQIALKKDIPQEKLDTFFQVVDMIKNNIEKEDFHDKNIIKPLDRARYPELRYRFA